jgi:glucose-1-phosphate thymidylyltransferase
MDKAVILARGLGTRMHKADPSVRLGEPETAVAAAGLKAMVPVAADRPFLDYVLSGLADAGYRRVCLVIGPEHRAVREHYTGSRRPHRVTVEFAIQAEPRGTADAVAAAEGFCGSDPFLMVNSDNYYPTAALAALRTLHGSGLVGFERQGLLDGSNIPADRVAEFAVIQADPSGRLLRILEKPDERTLRSLTQPICVSMNCWRFGPRIFEACRNIRSSVRGELELTDAVQYAADSLGEEFRVVPFSLPVLDLTSRADIAAVRAHLLGVEAEP